MAKVGIFRPLLGGGGRGEPAYVKTALALHLRNPFCRLLLPVSATPRHPPSLREARKFPAPRCSRKYKAATSVGDGGRQAPALRKIRQPPRLGDAGVSVVFCPTYSQRAFIMLSEISFIASLPGWIPSGKRADAFSKVIPHLRRSI